MTLLVWEELVLLDRKSCDCGDSFWFLDSLHMGSDSTKYQIAIKV